MALSPFVFIGAGGTGGKTLGVIRQTLLDALRRANWEASFPKAWQFVHIDVPAEPDVVVDGLPNALDRSHYAPMTTSTSEYLAFDRTVSQTLRASSPDPSTQYLAWDCWRPVPPETVTVQIKNGAGQYRGIGRVALQTGLAKVRNRLAAAFDEAKDGAAAAELAAVQRSFGVTSRTAGIKTPVVFLVGSVAGGSGSGMFLDVCDVLRAMGHRELIAVLFTPEVFTYGDGSLDPGVAPNTFMALHELSNSMWTKMQSDAPISRDHLFNRAGISHPITHNGPSTVFLVGRSNGAVTLADGKSVYQAVGRSLAELVTNEDLTTRVIAYDIANNDSKVAAGLDLLGLTTPQVSRDLAPFRAMGFARLCLGREFFDRYATERLCKLAVLRLLDHHLTLRQPGDDASEETLIERLAQAQEAGFFRDSGLDETGKSDVVIDALRTWDQLTGARGEFEAALAERIRSQADSKGVIKAAAARQQAAALVQSHLREESGLVTKSEAARVRRLTQWMESAHTAFGQLIVRTVAQVGLPVTINLVRRLLALCAKGVADLKSDIQRGEGVSARRLQALPLPASDEPATFRAEDNEAVAAVVQVASDALRSHITVQDFRLAAQVLHDAAEGLVKPWLRALRDAEGLLRRAARPETGIGPLAHWPGEFGIPEHLRPTQVEFLLDDPEAIPQKFVELLMLSQATSVDPDERMEGPAVDAAVREVLVGERLQTAARIPAVAAYVQPWITSWDRARPGGQLATAAQVRLRLAIPDIEQRVHSWLWDGQKAVGAHLREKIRDHLTDPLAGQEALEARRARLGDQLRATLTASRPLVALDATMVQEVHAIQEPTYALHMTPLDVPPQLTDLRERLQAVALAVTGQTNQLSWASDPQESAMALTLLSERFHTLEVASVMQPVADDWARLGHDPDFWKWRRARPLAEWVPLGPASRRDLVTGWFAARLLGAAYLDVATADPVPWVKVDGTWHGLPAAGVREATVAGHLGSLLENLPIAMLLAFRHKSLGPLKPYQELIKLGASCHKEVNPLSTWVNSARGMVDPARSALSGSYADRKERLRGIQEWLEIQARQYALTDRPALSGEVVTAQRNPSLEILADIRSALASVGEGAARQQDPWIP